MKVSGMAGVHLTATGLTVRQEVDYYYRFTHRTLVNGKKCDFKHVFNENKLNEEVETVIIKIVDNKQLSALLIERIDVYDEKREDGSVVKEIEFRFPLIVEGDDGNALHSENGVETVLSCVRGV